MQPAMDKEQILNQIFEDDPLGLLKVKARQSSTRTPDERLLASFQEINDFIEKNGREPEANPASVAEYQLHSRLNSLRADPEKVEMLKGSDVHEVLPALELSQANEPGAPYEKTAKTFHSLDDIMEDDSSGVLGGDDEDIFIFKHTPRQEDRASADFIAKRKPCKDFGNHEAAFKEVQQDLAQGKRKLIPFKQENLRPGDFYVSNGILLYLEHVDFEEEEIEYKSGKRVRKDGRTRTIFENGTESSMLYRSLYKAILANGMSVTQNFDRVNEGFVEQFSEISEKDEAAGYIYVLRSKSKDERIASIKNLYKIGYAKDVEERLKGAERQPTYLMAPVDYVAGWKCFNMNPQKLEQLIHNFFGHSCLNVDVFDENGKRYTPREWFIAPLEVIEQAIALIINGKITGYQYDAEHGAIVGR